jgi:hypothetical protein
VSLIVGDPGDPHVTAVLAAICADVHVIDAASFAQRSLTITSEGLEDGGQPIIAKRGWIRRLAPPSWTSSLEASTLVGAQRAAGLSALAAILHDERISWLTPVGRLGPAENKPFQYRHAQSVHVPVPEWMVTTDPRRAPEDNGWVTKPLGPGSFIDEGGTEQIVPTTPFDPATRSALAGAPFILQRRAFARTHARVVTVGAQVFSATLPADDLPTDWRLSRHAHHAFTTNHAPDSVHALASTVARQIGVGYSAQDWIQDTAGDWWFIDLNPAGQWLFLPEPVAADITAALGRFLEGQP